MKKILLIFNFWRLIIPGLIFCLNSDIRHLISRDLQKIQYALPNNSSDFFKFVYALVWNSPYRAVLL